MIAFKFFSILVITLILSSVNFAQAKELTKEEFTRDVNRAWEASRSLDRREELVSESSFDSALIMRIERTDEYISPDRHHWTVRTLSAGKEFTFMESIIIGKDAYCRQNRDESWTLMACKFGASDNKNDLLREQYFVQTIVQDDRTMKLYSDSKTYLVSNSTKQWVSETHLWIDSDGRVLRRSSNSKSLTSDSVNFKGHSDLTIEYNPKDLKIEAPVK